LRLRLPSYPAHAMCPHLGIKGVFNPLHYMPGTEASWRSGDVADCKSAHPGSIPGEASKFSRPQSGPRTGRNRLKLHAKVAPMTPDRPFWHPDRHMDRRPLLLARNRIKSALRAWFEAEGFVEVDTACLQISPGNEAHLHAFKTEFVSETGRSLPYYLHTSPEFACKKLLAAGETKIFTFAPVFRNGERSALHSPEFTMLEWYRAGAPYEQLTADCEQILRVAAAMTGRWQWTFRDKPCDISEGRTRTTLHEAFAKFPGIALDACFTGPDPDLAKMRQVAASAGVRVADDDNWPDLFSRILSERIEPWLGLHRPEVLCEYPTHEAALARPCAHDPRVAERFELYVCGVELANCFGELTDPGEQRRRFETEMDEKQRVYGRRYPIDEDFLAALAHMPTASGGALGFDRLVMLATGVTSVDQVIWTPVA
jgi:elongation factor P--(R)-beta-lysine ligase